MIQESVCFFVETICLFVTGVMFSTITHEVLQNHLVTVGISRSHYHETGEIAIDLVLPRLHDTLPVITEGGVL